MEHSWEYSAIVCCRRFVTALFLSLSLRDEEERERGGGGERSFPPHFYRLNEKNVPNVVEHVLSMGVFQGHGKWIRIRVRD